MEKLKNVGAGPVSAQKEVIDDCPEFSKISKQKNFECNNMYSNFNGITLIALIITVIVMLILVGVTITVALNGGLFESATKAATETQKETERERLTEIALANYNVAEGKITSADDLASKIESSLGLKKDADKTTETKLVVKGKDTLWQIDLTTAEVKEKNSVTGVAYKVVDGGAYIIITSDDKIVIKNQDGTLTYGEDIGATVINEKVDWDSLGVTKVTELTITEEDLKMLGVDHFPPTLDEIKNHEKFIYQDGEPLYFVTANYITLISIDADGSLTLGGDGTAVADSTVNINDILN